MSMDQDWDIVSGVGITALFVAAAREIESTRPNRLINDPYAAVLVRAASVPVPLPGEGDEIEALWKGAIDYLGVRSRYFDDFFARCTASGVGQAVILASGLDTRAYRLDWPESFRAFEIDQPKVLEFKERVLSDHGTKPACAHQMVPKDLREDWAQALWQAGFDPAVPTAWLAEGLLPYLPAAAERGLVETVHSLSAPGSRVAVENVTSRAVLHQAAASEEAQRRWGVDINELFNHEQRPHAADLFGERGWRVSQEPTGAVIEEYGREITGPMATVADEGSMLIAELPS